jgi:uncharacterized protein YajQ (UPF0234 family)
MADKMLSKWDFISDRNLKIVKTAIDQTGISATAVKKDRLGRILDQVAGNDMGKRLSILRNIYTALNHVPPTW